MMTERTKKKRILTKPASSGLGPKSSSTPQKTLPTPAAAIPAPRSPPIREWDDDEGRPNVQVMRFQAVAVIMATRRTTTTSDADEISRSPVRVKATALPP